MEAERLLELEQEVKDLDASGSGWLQLFFVREALK